MTGRFSLKGLWLGAALLLAAGTGTHAAIVGVAGPAYAFTAQDGYISTADGGSIYMWGYASNGTMQFPGPTMIVEQGQVVTVTLTNLLAVPTSIVFPGQEGVQASGGAPGLMTQEAAAGGGTVTYSFLAARPGTFTYHSGTNADLQCEMGLVGALIIRPTGHPDWAYDHPDTAFDREFLFVLSDMDPTIHDKVEFGQAVDQTLWWPTYWFINGRTGPDTMADDFVPWLPSQPYSCAPLMKPSEKVLMRLIGTGHDAHPYHHHGNNAWTIAVDGRMLESAPGAGPDLAVSDFTIRMAPGQTKDAIYTWTGYGIGWDVYGHVLGQEPADPARRLQAHELYEQSTVGSLLNPGDTTLTMAPGDGVKFPATFRAILWNPAYPTPDADTNREVILCAKTAGDTFAIQRAREGTTAGTWVAGTIVAYTDHGVPIPVTIPSQQFLFNGQYFSGSTYLGSLGQLPPGEGGFDPNGGFAYMWHSHNEREIVNNNLFPGGMLTMAFVDPPWAVLP